jgi:hypothetical protein
MFKLIFRLVGILIISAIVFLILSFWQGGKPFRWFGEKSQKAGEIVKEKSEEFGKEADRIKNTTDEIKHTTKQVTEGIKKTGDKIKDITGSKNDKSEH